VATTNGSSQIRQSDFVPDRLSVAPHFVTHLRLRYDVLNQKRNLKTPIKTRTLRPLVGVDICSCGWTEFIVSGV
jgi:hypothetical protein